MSSVVQRLIEIGRESCQLNGGLLHVDFTRAEKDYPHKEAHGTVNGLGRCLPSPMMGEDTKLSFSANGKIAEICFSAASNSSNIVITGEGGTLLDSGKGPSLLDFHAACQSANLDQRRDFACQGLRDEKTKVANVFDYLPMPKAA